jgi:putative NIF3 family GTP cyclohydrolase 1 type 2
MKTLATIMIFAFFGLFSGSLYGQNSITSKNTTAAGIIETIIKNTGSRIYPKTVDVIKAGDPETRVTGIVTSMFGTMDVLKKAVALNCNLIIVHEPLFYNHLDETAQLSNDPVYLEKKKFIDDHKLVIWRFHDYIHSIRPDGILSGMVRKLGWKDYVLNGHLDDYLLPETTLEGLLEYLKNIFPGNTFNVVGDPALKLSRVSFLCGAPGSNSHIRALSDKNVDVVIAGEVPQWETYEYARDAVLQGRPKAIIFIGHINSEEAGMDYCSEWLNGFIKDIPVHFVECGPSFWSY